MFKDKKSLPQDPQAEPETPAKAEYFPTMGGTFSGFKPQWKHRGDWGESINKRHLKMEGGDKWTDVSFVVIRGGLAVTLPDGQQVPVGVPFPRHMPGILETIFMCGYEQAMALAWCFASHVAAAGGEIEVRAEEYTLNYDIKAKLCEAKKAA